MSDGEYVTELWLNVGASVATETLVKTLLVEYEDLMELRFYDNFDKHKNEQLHIRLGARIEIGDRVKQMCINLYEGGIIDGFDYGECFSMPCDGYDESQYEEDKANGYLDV